MIYGISIYAWSGFAEWSFSREAVHLSPFLVLRFGLLLGTVLAIVLIRIIIALMKGSSRGHRIIIESSMVLCLSFLIGGIQVVSDLNTALDENSPVEVKVNITSLYKHRPRRGVLHQISLKKPNK